MIGLRHASQGAVPAAVPERVLRRWPQPRLCSRLRPDQRRAATASAPPRTALRAPRTAHRRRRIPHPCARPARHVTTAAPSRSSRWVFAECPIAWAAPIRRLRLQRAGAVRVRAVRHRRSRASSSSSIEVGDKVKAERHQARRSALLRYERARRLARRHRDRRGALRPRAELDRRRPRRNARLHLLGLALHRRAANHQLDFANSDRRSEAARAVALSVCACRCDVRQRMTLCSLLVAISLPRLPRPGQGPVAPAITPDRDQIRANRRRRSSTNRPSGNGSARDVREPAARRRSCSGRSTSSRTTSSMSAADDARVRLRLPPDARCSRHSASRSITPRLRITRSASGRPSTGSSEAGGAGSATVTSSRDRSPALKDSIAYSRSNPRCGIGVLAHGNRARLGGSSSGMHSAMRAHAFIYDTVHSAEDYGTITT